MCWDGVPLKLSFQESSALPLVITCAGSPAFIKGRENVFINVTSGLQFYKVTPLLKKQASSCKGKLKLKKMFILSD